MIERLERNFELGGHMAAAIARIAEKHDIYIISEMPVHLAEKGVLHTSERCGGGVGRGDEKAWRGQDFGNALW
ncbi:MAG: hypothetical protein QMD78_00780 [Methanocellales archaeon]|nr:hypothetical protein [Methanocellales archaeon]